MTEQADEREAIAMAEQVLTTLRDKHPAVLDQILDEIDLADDTFGHLLDVLGNSNKA